MRIGLKDFGKIPNVALMKISAWHKQNGDSVILGNFLPSEVDRVYASVVFEKDRAAAEKLKLIYPDVRIGGTGYDISIELPPEIEAIRPDYDLYGFEDIYPKVKGRMSTARRTEKTIELITAGIGFTTRGCVRTEKSCPFCVVPKKEGHLRQAASIGELINPRSNNLILLDNNISADPLILEKLKEIRERNLRIDIAQGVDVRLMSDALAEALASVKHMRSLHFAWDQTHAEKSVWDGVGILSRFVRKSKLMCFMLCGFNTSWEEDIYRFKKLTAEKVDPFVMVYNGNQKDLRLKHFARWVNNRLYKVCEFERYDRWERDRQEYFSPSTNLSFSF